MNIRNIIAHQYYEFGETDIYDIIKDINIIKQFVDKTKKKIKEKL